MCPKITPTTAKGIENNTTSGSTNRLEQSIAKIKNIIAKEINAVFFHVCKVLSALFFSPRYI